MPPFLLISSRGGIADSGDPDPGGGAPEPDGGSTIEFDTRAGGANDFQVLTTIAQMEAEYSAERYSNGASGFFESDVDGSGTNARGIQWVNDTNGTEQEAYLGAESGVTAPASGWYTQFKVRFGRRSGGSGSGTVDYFALDGSNAHQKVMLWLRGTAGHRIYIAMRPGQTKFSIDGLSWNSPDWDENLYDYTGQVVKVTCYFSPTDGIVQAWINDTQVLDATGQNIGASTMVGVQETATTRLPVADMCQYMWDTVVWY